MCTGSKVNTALDSSQTEWLSHYLSAGLESVSRENFIIPCTCTYFGICSLCLYLNFLAFAELDNLCHRPHFLVFVFPCICVRIFLFLQSLTMSAIARIAVSPRLSLAALRSIRPATVQVLNLYFCFEQVFGGQASICPCLFVCCSQVLCFFRLPISSPPPPPSLTSILPPSSSELVIRRPFTRLPF